MLIAGRGIVLLRLHRLWADAMVAAAVFGASLGMFLGRGPASAVDPTIGPVTVLLLSSLCLVVRRRFPWMVWTATGVLGVVAVVLAGGPTPAYVPAIVALYSVCVRAGLARAVIAFAVSVIFSVLGALAVVQGSVWVFDDPVAYGLVGWNGVALMSAVAVRAQRAAMDSANERARIAEASREEEAQRRVVEDRMRIARELHDVVGHHVSVINVQAAAAGVVLKNDVGAAEEALRQVRLASRQVLQELPALIGLLRTVDDDFVDRAPAPRLVNAQVLIAQARSSGVEVTWQTEGRPSVLAAAVDLTAYRVVQEGLTNAIKHGLGDVLIRVKHEPDGLVVLIRNRRRSGDSFSPPGGFGIVGLRERVAAIGGTISAGPADPNMWELRVTLPFERLQAVSKMAVQ